MLGLIAVIALTNLGLGYALALYLGREGIGPSARITQHGRSLNVADLEPSDPSESLLDSGEVNLSLFESAVSNSHVEARADAPEAAIDESAATAVGADNESSQPVIAAPRDTLSSEIAADPDAKNGPEAPLESIASPAFQEGESSSSKPPSPLRPEAPRPEAPLIDAKSAPSTESPAAEAAEIASVTLPETPTLVSARPSVDDAPPIPAEAADLQRALAEVASPPSPDAESAVNVDALLAQMNANLALLEASDTSVERTSTGASDRDDDRTEGTNDAGAIDEQGDDLADEVVADPISPAETEIDEGMLAGIEAFRAQLAQMKEQVEAESI